MKSISKYISSALMVAALGTAFTACDDWTEPESVDLDYGTIDADTPAYTAYLANLREYRNTDHKRVYTWFNNSQEAFGSQGHRFSALPDSIDVIVIQNPDGVTNQQLQEMYEARVKKGQQFSYCIDFNAIKADWTLKCEELAAKRLEFQKEYGEDAEIPAELEDPEFTDYMAEAWTTQLSYFNTVGFDCIMAAFDGKATNHLTAAELAEYNAQANLFLGILADWHARNPNVPIDYLGKPQNITDKAILNDFRYVFLSEGLNATNPDMFSLYYNAAEGTVPDSKIGMVAAMRAVDTNADPKTGIFSNGTLAVSGLATWTAAHNVGAVGVFNAENDYFVTNGDFTNIRELIEKVNPAAK